MFIGCKSILALQCQLLGKEAMDFLLEEQLVVVWPAQVQYRIYFHTATLKNLQKVLAFAQV